MKSGRYILHRIAAALLLASAVLLPAHSQDKDQACLKCHAPLAAKKEVHAAVHMGCASCHGEVDASTTPHKSPGKSAKELATEGSGMCLKCHDAKLFQGKVAHAPVEAGMCLVCHNSHSSDYQGLLRLDKALLCLDCHPDVAKGPHVIAGFSRSGHPLGDVPLLKNADGTPKPAEDPLRPGKTFYCAACHEPHRSEHARLMKFPGKGMALCQTCHKK